MAIFGDLSDLPLPEVLNMLGRRTGRLELVVPETGEAIEIHLDQGELRGVLAGDAWIDDTFQVRDRLTSLMDATNGSFRFHRDASENLRGELRLSVPQLLLSIAAAVDELSHYRERFAHPATRFVCRGGDEVWLDQELFQFLERAQPFLVRGTDAVELAREFALSTEQIQLRLYKLRSVGRVAPMRSFIAETPAPVRSAGAVPAPAVVPAPGSASTPASVPTPAVQVAVAAAATTKAHEWRRRFATIFRTLKERAAL